MGRCLQLGTRFVLNKKILLEKIADQALPDEPMVRRVQFCENQNMRSHGIGPYGRFAS